MHWLFKSTTYENPGDCDFRGCPNFTLPPCPIDYCIIYFGTCLIYKQ